MIILGVDPGTRVTGYGIIEILQRGMRVLDFGCIRPPPKEEFPIKYRIIFEGISHLLDRFQPGALSIETQYIDKNVRSAMSLGRAQAVVVLAAALREIPVFEYAPSKAKRAVVGNGRASKHQTQRMVQQLLSLAEIPEPEDAADALSLAICHAHSIRARV